MQHVTRIKLGVVCPTAPCRKILQCFAPTVGGQYCPDCLFSIRDNIGIYIEPYRNVTALLALGGGLAPRDVDKLIQDVVKNPRNHLGSTKLQALVNALYPRFADG